MNSQNWTVLRCKFVQYEFHIPSWTWKTTPLPSDGNQKHRSDFSLDFCNRILWCTLHGRHCYFRYCFVPSVDISRQLICNSHCVASRCAYRNCSDKLTRRALRLQTSTVRCIIILYYMHGDWGCVLKGLPGSIFGREIRRKFVKI